MNAATRRDLPAIAAVTATVFWSAGNVLVRGATLPGPQLAFWRTLIGAGAYTAYFLGRGGRLDPTALRRSALGGIGFGLQATLYFSALRTTSLTNAAVIAALQPVMLVPVSARMFGDRLDRTRLVLMGVAVAGTILVVTGGEPATAASRWGDLLAFAATIVGCLYFVGTKTARRTLDTLEYQVHALWVAAACALPGALVLGSGWVRPGAGDLLWPALMTLIPGTGHLLMSWAQRHLSVAFTATVSLDVAVLTALGGAFFFDEVLTLRQILGIIVVVSSLAWFVRSSTERIDPVAEEL